MPVFRYQCVSCGLNFSARVPNATSEAKCACGVPARKELPRGVSVTTSVTTSGLSSPDSGLSAHDYEIDRIVGADAKSKWGSISSRQKEKIQVLQTNGVTGFDLTKKPDGSYGVLTPQQRAASERTRAWNAKMDSHLREKYPEETKSRLDKAIPLKSATR